MHSIESISIGFFKFETSGWNKNSDCWDSFNFRKLEICKFGKNLSLLLWQTFTKNNFLNLKKGLSNYLNLRETYLDSDFLISTAPATSYDTDLENFWTQTSKKYFFGIFELLLRENGATRPQIFFYLLFQ